MWAIEGNGWGGGRGEGRREGTKVWRGGKAH